MSHLLGIDIGSTNLKAAIFRRDGSLVSRASLPNEVDSPQWGWAEYNADRMWNNLVSCLRSCLSSAAEPLKIAALSISSMGEVGVPLDRDYIPLYPAISWFDRRTTSQADWWRCNFGRERVFSISGMPLDPMYSVNKIMWLRANTPDVFRHMRKWACMPDFVVWKLTGRLCTDYTIASRTMAFDVRKKSWSPEICEAAGVDPDVMPEVAPSGTVVGGVTPEASKESGIPEGTPVVLGGHDHACVAVALGLAEQGNVVDSTGTGEALVLVKDSADLPLAAASTNRYACYPHCVPERYLVLGHLGVVGGVLDWVSSLLGRNLEPLEIRPDLPVYIPHFNSDSHTVGESGAWLGLSPACDARDLLSSVMEGMCYWFRQSLELTELVGSRPAIKLVGGLARYHQLTQLKADVMGSPIEVFDYPDLALLGAAIVAGIGVGVYDSWEAHTREIALPTHIVTPDGRRSGLYEARYRRYRLLAARLEPLMTDPRAERTCSKLGGEV